MLLLFNLILLIIYMLHKLVPFELSFHFQSTTESQYKHHSIIRSVSIHISEAVSDMQLMLTGCSAQWKTELVWHRY